MKKLSIHTSLLLGLLTVVTNANAQVKFSDYPTPVYQGKKNIVWNREAKSIKTTLNNMRKEPISFAGEYIEGSMGCGTSCYNTFFLNVRTGKIVSFDIPLDYYAICTDGTDAEIITRPNSKLMVVKGGLNLDVMAGTEQICDIKYFIENNGKLKEIKP